MILRRRAYFSDLWQLLRRVTFQRLWNAVKVVLSYFVASLTRRPIHWGRPIAVAVEPTTACNLRCPQCPSGLRSFTRPTGKLDRPFFESLIDQIHRQVLWLTFYFQGEPYLHPDFHDMVAYASRKRLYTATSTNAHFLDDNRARATVESGLCRLIISVDGTTQEVYEQYRVGGRLEKVLAGASCLAEWKRRLRSNTPFIIWQFLVLKPNEYQIPEALRLARRMGADEIRFKTAQIYDYQNGHHLIPVDPRYARYAAGPDGHFYIKAQLKNHCWRMWHSCVITWDGRVVPCCFDKDANHILGHLKDQDMKTIWQGKAYRDFRRRLLLQRKDIDICSNCTEGLKVYTE
ncbi:MAG: SPASM domain-containing protein [Flavobacteriales bacterium]|nr:SPASM domain-containing protein [Flavobacteriales bacterium]